MSKACCESCTEVEKSITCIKAAFIDLKGGGGRIPVKFVDTLPEGIIPSNSNCSSNQRRLVELGLLKIKPVINRAYSKWDKKIFKKWFGTGDA
jgi:hypothetical protein